MNSLPPPSERLQVFVYGTLKPGGIYYRHYCEAIVIDAHPAIAFGQLFDLPLGYPAMTTGDRPVYGFVLSFADWSILTALDHLEGYDPQRPAAENEYTRQLVEINDLDQQPLGMAWVYMMTVEQVTQLGGALVPSGNWSGKQT
ncbi:gamma-glutamylcyclotransferase [Oculatella sp. LEGE 06141]|uniref:gamma-glutamylcyclotransferase family protein n=1 Tax=Oculatella sp. LEGE 06141 TaxID=1828648 RepID=UPI00187EEEF1|nr:gamma-glutamylcyclotransferase family protein [Oculatella sp. LEGE 06141]MBE9181375.1 gamma-glutamylcyclotransferase [Oculatella sp. LEGE 06141]